MYEDILREIGLTDSEIRVYLSLLRLGDTTRGQIVAKSGIAGSKVYDILEKLGNKGLISIYLKDSIKHFKATNPIQILNYLENKKRKVNEAEEKIKMILPEFLSIYNLKSQKQSTELVTGLKGLEVIFREQVEIMKSGETCYVIGGIGANKEIINSFFEKIHLMRERKQIKTKMLYNLLQKKEISKIYSRNKYPHTTVKYIPHTVPVAINVYVNKTIIIIYGEEITAIAITSEDVAKSFKEYFEILWKK
jgi:sugar-specific transcriptional regulator TrmB